MAAEHHEPDAFHHVLDAKELHIFEQAFGDPITWPLPAIPTPFGPFQITKYMVLELVAAVLIMAIFIPLARRASTGALPRGSWWNAFESLLTFIRNQVARPAIGGVMAERLTPFLWTLFLFILACNLLGMIPFMGSPTSSLWVNLGLALVAFIVMHGVPIAQFGVGGYLKSLWPGIDTPVIGFVINCFIWTLEMLGTVIKSGVLAVRLFANIFAGHLVLAMILMFIYTAGKAYFAAPGTGTFVLWTGVTFASVFGVVALSLLELFVAFLQAYVFTFLTALFIGMALHHGGDHGHDEEHGHDHGHGHEPAHAH